MTYPERIWIGPNFEKQRILVLGESWWGDFPDDLSTDDGYIRAYLEGRVTDAMYTRMANACEMTKKEFWEGILFTNFVQRVGATRDIRPTKEDYASARERLARILREHKPCGVWILGVEQGAYSAPVVAEAGVAYEVSAHPTSYGLKNSALGASWRSLLTKAKSNAPTSDADLEGERNIDSALSFSSDGESIQRHEFAYRRSPDQDSATPACHPVVVVGAGPVGLSLAIDLAQRGQRVLLLDNDSKLSTGSRAICFAKRTLEIWDRLGVGDAMCAKGVQWHVGRVNFKEREVYRFDLLPDSGHQRPAFINLQQFYAEAYLALRAAQLPAIDIRWRNNVVACTNGADGARLGIETPDGRYELDADYVVACDGSRSPLRGLLGLETQGRVFRDRFLIADISMQAPDFPVERRFWFDPPFHPGQSVLLHKQADDMWRVDFQLGWDADPDLEKRHERITPRVRALLDSIGAQEVDFSIGWASVYTFACQRMARFRAGRVLFAGDSAHGVSPFGARGANSGVQDADNLAWKLALVLRGQSPATLLDSYAGEREHAADENILNSTRSTDFITPKSTISRLFRDAVLDLAREHAFARRIVNSGRLSVPAMLHDSPLNTADSDDWSGGLCPGAPAADAPLNNPPGWLLRHLGGADFTLLCFGAAPGWAATLPLKVVCAGDVGLVDAEGWAARRYDARPGSAYLIRPDQHVCARWRAPDADRVRAGLARAQGMPP